MSESNTQPWHRRPDESPKAYQAARAYFELGADRSTAKVAQQFSKSKRLIDRWSSAYSWTARAAAFDLHLAQLAEQARAEALLGAEARWAERRIESREATWAIAERLHARAVEMLAFPLATVERTEQVRRSEDGRTTVIQQTIITPARWSLRDAAAIADLASKLARLAVGLETDRSLVLLEGLTPKDLDAMPMEQLLALRQMLIGRS